MRLTTYHREAFVSAALNDVPQEDFYEQRNKLLQDDAVSKLPPKVRAVYDDKALRDYLKTSSLYSPGSMGSVSCYAPHGYKPSSEVAREADRLNSLETAQRKRLNDLRSKLFAVANSVTTTKALIDLLPEFEKYVPKEENQPSKNLPAVANVLTEFVQAGWPKGHKRINPVKPLKAATKKV